MTKRSGEYNVVNAVKFATSGDKDPETPIFIRFLETEIKVSDEEDK